MFASVFYPGCYPGLGASALSGREGTAGHFRSRSFSVIKDFLFPKARSLRSKSLRVIKDFHFSLFDNTLDYFGNTFVTHMDDFAIHQIYNLLTNSYLQKEHMKEG